MGMTVKMSRDLHFQETLKHPMISAVCSARPLILTKNRIPLRSYYADFDGQGLPIGFIRRRTTDVDGLM